MLRVAAKSGRGELPTRRSRAAADAATRLPGLGPDYVRTQASAGGGFLSCIARARFMYRCPRSSICRIVARPKVGP